MQVKLPYQVVLLVRGEGSKTPLTVLPHEVEILMAIHGEEAIHLTDIKPPVIEAEFDTADEFARLEQYYLGDADNQNPTRKVFRNLDEFEAAFSAVAGSGGTDKDALIAEAKGLGIPANKNWGIEKLETAIAEAKAGSGGAE